MGRIVIETFAAPRELLELGDAVTWEARHSGIRQRLTAKITYMDPPTEFSDDQTKGAFDSFRHIHRFSAVPGGTLVVDDFTYRVPLGWIGLIADVLFVGRYMRALLRRRAAFLRRLAESAA